ncbi:SAM-dependent methyltransferase [Arcobacter sp. CECT 8986]|uniref:class I SAM-dependent methyltransferase n=1 Tax=Arcobacter sp. CECT 8986 TaxID=2044507 RepID=UPI001009D611|nr:class I SAM-dependent methyltransferase [Arcobacter sp. CECT 8986]RXJ97839.1 SAM-dependent methyltransferase [Arcobacter sp. CECT 8986]
MKFEDIDFNEMYKEQKQKTTFKPKSSDDWNNKAPSMNERVHSSIYNDEFLDRLNLDKIDSLLDVGCGVGNLSLKLAKKLNSVYSLDYSSKMLELLNENAKAQNITNITTINKSWYDNWDDIPNTDLVIASRSMEVKDMKEALVKLNTKANKKVVITYKKGGSFVSDEILDALGKNIIKKPDYIYILNILYSLGIYAKVDFINSEGRNTIYSSKERFIQSISWSIGALTQEEIKNLEDYYDNLTTEQKNKEEYVQWAMISWDKKA